MYIRFHGVVSLRKSQHKKSPKIVIHTECEKLFALKKGGRGVRENPCPWIEDPTSENSQINENPIKN